MKWKSKPNFLIAVILSFAYLIVTLLDMIGPLHMNAQGGMFKEGQLSLYSFIFLLGALFLTWLIYFAMRKKPELLFFTLIVLGIAFIILEVFLWGAVGA